jgi:cellulase/cellobiase CelA1
VLDHIPASERPGVVAAMEAALTGWLGYRDEVAASCGLEPR